MFTGLLLATVLSVQLDPSPIWMVRGDDFGVTHAGNVGLEEAIESGLLTSASVIVNGAWIAETASILLRHPEVEVGLHVTLSSEWDVLRWPSTSADAPTLVAPDGNMWRGGVTWLSPYARENDPPLYAALDVDPADIEREIRAQVDRAASLGLTLDYIDCHNWAACTGSALPILRMIANELGVPIPESERDDGAGTPPMMRYTDTEAENSRRRMGHDYEAYRDALLADIEAMEPGGVYRSVFHPWPDTDEVRAMDTVRGPEEAVIRSNELRLLSDPLIRGAIQGKSIRLMGPAAVARTQGQIP
ncbi:MAG: ChbG/HpnK family deacetylase [Gemmatimonadota bacterium]|nr:ChbG/HpnK family deacetylase [Gemmatimonadota bacterium]MDH5760938.1 ChbG/HpnK family deacetylase [Gemmatimonadota bacterium]